MNSSLLDIPKYITDLERLHRDIPFGEVGPFMYKKANGQVVKLVTKLKNSLRFRNNDEVLIYIVDAVRNLPADKDGSVQFVIEHKKGRITKVETTTEEEIDYPMDPPKVRTV